MVTLVEFRREDKLGNGRKVSIGLAAWRSLLGAGDRLEYLLDKGSEIPRQ